MKTKSFFSILFMLFYFWGNSQIRFQKSYGGNDEDTPADIIQTNDGGYAILGTTYSFGMGTYDAYMVKTNAYGDTMWTKTIGDINWDFATAFLQTTDGGYIITGATGTYPLLDVWLVKINASGSIVWTKKYGGNDYEICNSVQQTTDGGYIIVGSTKSFGAGGDDVYLIKVDSIGNLLWTKTYGTNFLNEIGNRVRETTDGGFIIIGRTHFGGNILVIKTDASGNLIWSKTYGGINYDYGSDIKEVFGGYILVGSTANFGAGSDDIILIRTDINGNVQWSKTYGGTEADNPNTIELTTDGAYIIAGQTASFVSGGPNDAWNVLLMKVDSVGNIIWAKSHGGIDYEHGARAKQTSDGGFIVTSYTYSYGAGVSDIFLIKTDTEGHSSCYQNVDISLTVSTPSLTVLTPSILTGFGGVESSHSVSSTNPATVVNSISSTESVPICLVTVDSLSQNNVIVWSKPATTGIDSFIVYRDTANNNFARIGTVSYDSLSHFIDTARTLYAANGDPLASSWRYKLAVVDTCGYISDPSPYHQSIFIQNVFSNFSWNHYQIEGQSTPVPGLNNYLFLRDNFSNGNFTTVQTLSASSTAYTDAQYSNYPYSSYRVKTQWTTSCSATKSTVDYNSSRSNVKLIAPPPQLNLSINTTDATDSSSCDGSATVTPTGGIPSFTYLWSTIPAQTDSTATGLCAGDYSVTVTDTAGTTVSASATVGVQTGISENEILVPTFIVYPNPNDGTFIIEFSTPRSFGERLLITALHRHINYR